MKCDCLTFPELPLKGNVDYFKFIIYYPDTSLLIVPLDEEAQFNLKLKKLRVYKSALCLNFIAETFLK